MSMISIIVPVYNCEEKYFSKCIDSILEQTYKDFELIIINDGSTNNIEQICQKYEKKDNRICYIKKENEGVSATRNLGIEKSKGKWIMFVDADDWLEADACEKLVKETSIDIDVIIGSTYINQKQEIDKLYKYKVKKEIENTEELIVSIFIDTISKYSYVDVPWAKLYKRDFLIENNIFFKENLFLAEDGLFNFEVYLYAKKIIYFPDCIYHYRLNNESACNTFNAKMIENYNHVWEYYEKLMPKALKKYDIKKEYDYFKIRQIIAIIKKYFMNPKNEKKEKELKKEFLALINSSFYKETIKNARYLQYTNKRKIFIYSIKTKNYSIIKFIKKIKM